MNSGIAWKLKVKLPLCLSAILRWRIRCWRWRSTLSVPLVVGRGRPVLRRLCCSIVSVWGLHGPTDWAGEEESLPPPRPPASHVGNSVVMFSWSESVWQDKLPKSSLVLHSELSLINSAADAASWNRPTKHVDLRKAHVVGRSLRGNWRRGEVMLV